MSTLSSYERTEKLLAFYGPERMQAQACGETFVVTAEMQAHAEAFAYDRARADAAAPSTNPATTNDDGASAKPGQRKGR